MRKSENIVNYKIKQNITAADIKDKIPDVLDYKIMNTKLTFTTGGYTCWKCKNKFQPCEMVRYFYKGLNCVHYCTNCFDNFNSYTLAWSIRKYKEHLIKLIEVENEE